MLRPLFILLALSTAARAQITPQTPGWFPFPISVMEQAASPVDLSFLNEAPAGKGGFLRVEGEKIVDGSGRELRFFGTNFCFGANFPDEALAPQIAAYLARSGVNIVRLHHMDSDGKDSLIADNATTTLHSGNLAKLDRLIAELIARGIYVNINLHVSRTYPGSPKDGPTHSKGVDHFHAPFIAMFKDYARKLLTHVNPHTGRAYKEEPGVAVIEMNNENTLLMNPWWLAKLPPEFAQGILALWRKELKTRYASNIEALRAKWGVHDGSEGPDVLQNGKWTVEATGGAKASVEKTENGLRWVSTQSGAQPHALQLYQLGIALDDKASYKLTFRARAAKPVKINVQAQNAAAPWANIGLLQPLQLTTEWQEHRLDFTPHSQLPEGKNRLGFNLLNQIAEVELADVRLRRVPDGFLRPEHSFEADYIPLPERGANLEVRRDFFRFLAQLEIDHASEMKAFIREEIGARQILTHSHLLFGGIAGARREFAVSDLVDTHGYWHHPHFPNKSWDMSDWRITNVSQIAEKTGGTLAELAMQRPAGKPYSVSEYDIPAPNDFAAETFPMLAAMASLQGWSAVYHFAFSHSADVGRVQMKPFFDLVGHPAKQSLLGPSALVFRQQLIPMFESERLLRLSPEAIHEVLATKSGDVWGSWRDAWAADQQNGSLAWNQRVGLDVGEKTQSRETAKKAVLTPKRLWQPETPLFVLESENALIASGKLAGQKLGQSIEITPGALDGDGHATLMLVPLDGQPLAKSKKLWLTALRRSENPGMAWNAERSTVGTDWGTAPALVLGLELTLKLPADSKWTVTPLSHTGAAREPLKDATRITPEAKTPWFLLTRD